MGNVAPIILLHELLLRRRAFQVQVNDDEVDAPFVLLVEADGAASLPLGVESTLAVENDIVWLSLDRTVVHVVARDQRAILAVA